MLINYVPGEECRIAIARDDRLEEFYQERAATESHVGNIYKGRVTNIESSIQAAFVDFGLERNGFLHISDLHPMHFPGKDREEFEKVGSKTPHRARPPIQRCLKRGQEVLVQVLKEGIGTKGPTLTTYLSIPGRFIVMMPYMERLGVSRKVDDDEARRESRKLLAELDPPEGFGFIVRTAGIGQTKTDLKRDLAYLQRLWKNIETRRKKIGKTGELYTESDLIIRTIRDVFSNDIDRIVVDEPTAAKRAYDFLTIASPRARSKVVYYNDAVPMYHRFGMEQQLDRIHDREVPLPSGGSLVIDSTEALVAIDVNSGKSREARDAESNAYNTNKEAVDEIARQLRLRDLGGVIVNDLIDMRDPKHRRSIEQRLRQNFRDDRARTRVGSISQFGLIEMTRQRMRPSLQTSNYNDCQHCHGYGYVKSPESVVLDVMRQLHLVMQHEPIVRIELTISPDVAFQLLNRKRGELTRLENRFNKSVMVRVGGHSIDHLELAAYDQRGLIDLDDLSKPDRLPVESEDAYVDLAKGKLPEAIELEIESAAETADADADHDADLEAEAESESGAETEALTDAQAGESEGGDQAQDQAQDKEKTEEADQEQPRSKSRRRRRRGGRARRKKKLGGGAGEGESSASDAEAQSTAEQEQNQDQEQASEAQAQPAEQADEAGQAARGDESAEGAGDEGESAPRKRKRRRRGGRGRRRGGSKSGEKNGDSTQGNGQTEAAGEEAGKEANEEAGEEASQGGGGSGSSMPARFSGSGYSNRLVAADESRAEDRAGDKSDTDSNGASGSQESP